MATVFVDQDALVRRHPLWREAARVDATRPMAGGPAGILSSEPVALKPATLAPGAAVDSRRNTARERLETAQRRGLATLESNRDSRVEDAVRARRTELEASEERALAEQIQQWTAQAEQEGESAARAVSAELAVLQAALDSTEAQLREGFLVPVPAEVLAVELARLAGSTAEVTDERGVRRVAIRWVGDIRGASTRARLTVAKDAIAKRIAELSGQIEMQRRDARARAERFAEAARSQAAQRVAREIERVREERRIDLAPLLEQQNFGMLLERTLAMEATPARLVNAGTAQGLAKTVVWENMPAPRVPISGPSAVGRRLRARAVAMVDARVQDIARELGCALAPRRSPGMPDQTGEFARRMGLQGE
jgi:hypothetical protein